MVHSVLSSKGSNTSTISVVLSHYQSTWDATLLPALIRLASHPLVVIYGTEGEGIVKGAQSGSHGRSLLCISNQLAVHSDFYYRIICRKTMFLPTVFSIWH